MSCLVLSYGYLWLSLAFSGYIKLSQDILGYLEISQDISGCVGISLNKSGYHWLFWAKQSSVFAILNFSGLTLTCDLEMSEF